MRRIVVAVLMLCSFAFASGGHTGSHSSKQYSTKTHSSRTKDATKNKSVHVRGYTRKDGTYVAPYDRSAPGTGTPSPSSTSNSTASHAYRSDYLAEGYAAHPSITRDKHGKIKRSKTARSAFERQSPCPSTGKASGRCPGYVVDHVKPLECGGADDPSNMQWQTTSEGKAKDKTERLCP
jgi:hypothetical protein